MRRLAFILIFWSFGNALAGPLSARLTTTLAQDLDPNPGADRASLTLEPGLKLELGPDSRALLDAIVERPLDPHREYVVPKISLEHRQGFDLTPLVNTALRASVTALSLDRWRTDGAIVRPGLRLEISRELASGLSAELLTGPYLHLSEEQQATDGSDLTRFGATESFCLKFRRGIFHAAAKVLFDQRRARIWYDDAAFSEAVSLDLSGWLTLGLQHDRFTSAVDPTTGRYRGFVNVAGTHRLGAFAAVSL